MDLIQIKTIPIIQILGLHGIHPSKTNEQRWLYFSFMRKEKTPSLKVDLQKNLFYDHGSGQGGSVIDIVMLLKGYSEKEAIDHLTEFDGTLVNERKIEINQASKESVPEIIIGIDQVSEIHHQALINYAKSRGIDSDFLKKYCPEVIYSIGDKRYFSIGFKNDKNGYELRNKFFKNCTSPKWYTYLNNGNDKLIIFEGFFDFLSLLQANQKSRNGYDYLILNSVTLRKKIPLELLENYAQIFLFLDNDVAGRDASQFFISSLPNVTDCSSLYGTYKDVNEWLVKRKKRE